MVVQKTDSGKSTAQAQSLKHAKIVLDVFLGFLHHK